MTRGENFNINTAAAHAKAQLFWGTRDVGIGVGFPTLFNLPTQTVTGAAAAAAAATILGNGNEK